MRFLETVINFVHATNRKTNTNAVFLHKQKCCMNNDLLRFSLNLIIYLFVFLFSYSTRQQFDNIGLAIVRKLKLPLTKDNIVR